MNAIQIVEQIYRELSALISGGTIPIAMAPPSLVGTVQDDPFDTGDSRSAQTGPVLR